MLELAINLNALKEVLNEGAVTYKWTVMITVACGVSMIVLDSTVLNVTLAMLRRTFGFGVDAG
jgi:hypothetical protein